MKRLWHGRAAGLVIADRGRLDNVLLSAVPEPGTWVLMLGGAALLLARRPGSRP